MRTLCFLNVSVVLESILFSLIIGSLKNYIYKLFTYTYTFYGYIYIYFLRLCYFE